MADRSVRTAWAADADAIGAVQVQAWTSAYADLLPPEALAELEPGPFAQAWRQAVERPPSARHRVLVALEGPEVVGFAATAPSEDPDADPAADGEVVAFHVRADALGQGHGSRLLTAVADTLRADRFTGAQTWLVSTDDALRTFLAEAGWAADGAHRTLDLTGDGTTVAHQVRLHTDLREAP